MSAIDNSLVGQPATKRPGGKPQTADEQPQPATEQPFGATAQAGVEGSGSTRRAPGVGPQGRVQGAQPGHGRSDAEPLGDNTEYSNGAGSNAS